MPFALGVAIANLFQRIADALSSGGLPSGGGTGGSSGGGGTGSGGSGSGGGSGGGGSLPAPGGTPPTSPPPVVVIPPIGLPQPPTGNGHDCPPLSEVDMRALEDLPLLLPPALLPQTTPLILFPAEEEIMPLAQGSGTIVESVDFFRFRAISTSDNVPVSFFGRIQLLNGQMVPFNRVLDTSTANTIFETTMQTGPGFLLGAAASVPVGSITTGSVNAIGEIGRIAGGTFTPHTVLFSGQVDDQAPLSSNLAVPAPPVQRPTFYAVESAASQASPVTFTLTPSPGKRIRVTRVFAQMTLAVAANARAGRVTFAVGGNNTWASFGQALMGSGENAQIQAAIGGQPNSTTNNLGDNGALLNIPLPESLYFYEEFQVSIVIQNNNVNDRLDTNTVYYEET